MSELISHLRANKLKKKGGLEILNKINNFVIAVVIKLSNEKEKYICNSENSNEKDFEIDQNNFAIFPHIPLGKERYIIFFSGASGMGKSSLTAFMAKQHHKLISKKIFYIAGTDKNADKSLAPLKFIKQISGENLEEINVDEDFRDSLVIFDDIDNWTFHKEAIKILNQCYEIGRKFQINIIYISHVASKASESKIYGEVDMYITNKATKNRMMEHHLELSNEVIKEIESYLNTDVYVCYNKIYNCIYTDKKIYKLN